jgi:uncharacterized MnhB-related membrane protein
MTLLNVLLLSIVFACGVAAITLKDLLACAVLLGAYSFFMAIIWAEMGAVDVAFTEASVGAGVTTVFFVMAILRLKRRQKG